MLNLWAIVCEDCGKLSDSERKGHQMIEEYKPIRKEDFGSLNQIGGGHNPQLQAPPSLWCC